jgi:hypothetical protein
MKNTEIITKMLDSSTESFYWWGYIIADGSIDKNYNITLTCDIKDLEHLTKFATYVNKKVTFKKVRGYYKDEIRTICLVNIANKKLLKPFKEETLNWLGKKTYEPIKLDYFKTNNLIYFLIGLIDGDGCLYLTKKWNGDKKFKNCRIVIHQNWLPFLELLQKEIESKYNIKSVVKLNSRYNATMYIKDSEINKILPFLKNTPHLNRKWGKFVNV